MSEPNASPNTDLTGYWFGEYWYDAGMGSLAQFAAHIKDAGAAFDGTTLETADDGLGSRELTACITGSRESLNIEFTKLYDAGQRIHREPIFYAGTLDADLTQIEGRWMLTEGRYRLNGGFRMQRGSGGAKVAVTRKVEEPVLVGAEKQAIVPGKPRRK